MILPPMLVWLGGKVVVGAKNQIDEDTNDVLKPMIDDAQAAQAPQFFSSRGVAKQPNPTQK